MNTSGEVATALSNVHLYLFCVFKMLGGGGGGGGWGREERKKKKAEEEILNISLSLLNKSSVAVE